MINFHPDHLGSTNIVTNSAGNVVENTSYNPYGEVIQNGKSRYLFTGKELDRETNFEYYGARYYYPYLTRFIQPDLIIQDFYNPQSLNRYTYVLNNPYKYVDPSGNYAESFLDISFIALDINDIRNDPRNWVNYLSLSADVLGAALPVFTGGRLLVKGSEAGVAGLKNTDNLNKISDIGKTLDKGIDSIRYTKNNFRSNLGKLSGRKLTKTEEAHHVFPVKFEKDFNKANININKPEYGSIVDKGAYRSFSYQYNKDWETFFTLFPNAKKEDVLKYGEHLSEQYKFKANYKVPKK